MAKSSSRQNGSPGELNDRNKVNSAAQSATSNQHDRHVNGATFGDGTDSSPDGSSGLDSHARSVVAGENSKKNRPDFPDDEDLSPDLKDDDQQSDNESTSGHRVTEDNGMDKDAPEKVRGTPANTAGDGLSDGGVERRGRGFGLMVVAAVTVVLMAGVAATWAGVSWNTGRSLDKARSDAVAAAREEAVNLTSINFRHADRDVRNVLDHATGEFASLFQQNMDSYAKIVKDGQVVTTGNVVGAGVESSNENSARVLLAVQSKVQNKQVPAGEARGYRMVASLNKQPDGEWRVGRVEFLP